MSFLNRPRRTSSIKSLLRKQMRCSYRNLHLGDKDYDSLFRGDVTEFLKYDKTDKLKYKKEKFDCENFALRLMSNAQLYFVDKLDINPAFGMCWVQRKREEMRAINFFVSKVLNSIVYIEPQTDTEYFLNGERVRFVLL